MVKEGEENANNLSEMVLQMKETLERDRACHKEGCIAEEKI